MRVQRALNVTDIEEAVAFYSKHFATSPAKRRPGYANFAIDEPPLKLVLFESASDGGTLTHLGVETEAYGASFLWRELERPDERGYTVWGTFADDTDYFGAREQAFMLNFRVAGLEALDEREYGDTRITRMRRTRMELGPAAAGRGRDPQRPGGHELG